MAKPLRRRTRMLTTLAVGLLAAAMASAQPQMAPPRIPQLPMAPPQMPQLGAPVIKLQQLRDLLGDLEKLGVPFEFRLEITAKCMGALCGTVQQPNTIGPPDILFGACQENRKSCVIANCPGKTALECARLCPLCPAVR